MLNTVSFKGVNRGLCVGAVVWCGVCRSWAEEREGKWENVEGAKSARLDLPGRFLPSRDRPQPGPVSGLGPKYSGSCGPAAHKDDHLHSSNWGSDNYTSVKVIRTLLCLHLYLHVVMIMYINACISGFPDSHTSVSGFHDCNKKNYLRLSWLYNYPQGLFTHLQYFKDLKTDSTDYFTYILRPVWYSIGCHMVSPDDNILPLDSISPNDNISPHFVTDAGSSEVTNPWTSVIQCMYTVHNMSE